MSRTKIARWCAVLVVLVATMLASTGTANAQATADFTRCGINTRCMPPAYDRAVGPNYIGWVNLDLNYCAPGMACVAMYQVSAPAWSWSGTAWKKTSIQGDQQVYVYPYTGQWRWVWTQATGWVAMNEGRFTVRSYGTIYY